MNARLERKLRFLAWIVAAGVIAGMVFNFAQGRTTPSSMVVGFAYGLLMSIVLGSIELFVLEGPMRVWLSSLSFTANLVVRSAIYAAIIVIIQWFQLGEMIAGLPLEMSGRTFWSGLLFSALISVVINLGLGIINIIGPRAFLNFVAARSIVARCAALWGCEMNCRAHRTSLRANSALYLKFAAACISDR
jgi:adenylate cyclase